MKIEHLDERIIDYTNSIETVIEKKIYWKNTTRKLIRKTITAVTDKYKIGWQVRELNWINNNEAINIVFDSFPPSLMERTNEIPSYQFIQGGALGFSQSYSGNVNVVIILPMPNNNFIQENVIASGVYKPQEITEKLIIEKIDDFLKEMIDWEDSEQGQNQVGFQSNGNR